MAIHDHGNGSRDAAILLLRKGDVTGILRGDGGHDYIITILAGKLMGDGGLFLVFGLDNAILRKSLPSGRQFGRNK